MPATSQSFWTYYADSLCTDMGLKTCATFGMAGVSWVVGGIDQLVTSLVLLMVFDFMLGFSRGYRERQVSGAKLKHGLMKFILYGVAVQIALQMQRTLFELDPTFMGLRLSIALRDWLIAYLVLNEGLSCLDHLAYFRVPIPQRLVLRIKSYRDKLCHTSKDDVHGPREA